MSVRQRNVHSDYRIVGVFATAAAYLADRNVSSASEGDLYYNTTLDQLQTYSGSSWSPAGMTGIGPGSLDAAANIGSKITIDSAFTTGVEIEAEDGNISTNGALLLLDNDDTGADVHCLELTNAGTAAALQFTAAQAGSDAQGTSNTWILSSAGAITGTSLTLGDDNAINIGAATDAVLQWDQTRLALTAAADSVFRIGAAAFSYDVEFIGNTATTNLMKWDLDGGAGSVGALVFDNADLDLGDSDLIRFGDSADFTLGVTAGSPNNLILLGSGEQLTIGADDEGIDVYWYSENTGDYVYFDETNALVDFVDINLDLDDDAILRFGSSNDFTIQNIAGSPNVLRITGDDERLDFGVSGAGFDMYWMTEDTTNYIYWDEDNSRMDMVDVDLRLDDDARLYFGSDADVYFDWDDTNDELDFVGDLNITGDFSVSGAFDIGNFSFGDDEELRFGNSNDFVFQYDSATANMAIDAAAANDIIDVGSTVNTDLILHGGTATYDVHWDSSENTLAFLDDAVLGFGNTAATPDVEIKWDQTRLNITGSGEEIRIGADTAPLDIRFYGTGTGDYMLFDGDLNTNGGLLFEDITLTMMDDTKILLGDGSSGAGDFSIDSDGTDLFIKEIASAGKIVKIGVSGKGLDVQFYGDSAGKDMLWDQDEDALTFQDGAAFKLGTGNDLVQSATDTTITSTIAAGSIWNISDTDNASSRLTLGVTGGSNGLDVYFNTISAGEDMIFDAALKTFKLDNVDLILQDDDILALGDASDITFVWDQTRLLVDGATADTVIRIGATNNQDIIIYGDTSTDFVTFDTSEEDIRTTGFDLTIQDDDVLNFGADDITITWDSTNNDLLIDGAAADTEIKIGRTNNQDLIIYGDNSAQLITFDTSEEDVRTTGFDITIQDDDILNFGTSDDVQIFWDKTQLQIDGGSIFIGDQTNYVTINATGDITCTLNTTSFSSLVLPTHGSSNPDTSKTGTTGAIYYQQDTSVIWVCASGTTWLSTAALS